MDTSEEYIKMCEKVHLWDERELLEGDYYAYLKPKIGKSWCLKTRQRHIDENLPAVVCTLTMNRENEVRHHFIEDIERCWLPRQDQLQEMIETRFAWEKLNQFNCWFDDEVYVRGMLQFDNSSMEQLWLAFIMKEEHNKLWNGEDWVE